MIYCKFIKQVRVNNISIFMEMILLLLIKKKKFVGGRFRIEFYPHAWQSAGVSDSGLYVRIVLNIIEADRREW